ncbi:MAG: DUF2975 domain-containing protein, partial [Bifidobacteriaceae bacterium]|nr:DUF2975 domain-containing protein [Bifidobacteriaceae bacterium]
RRGSPFNGANVRRLYAAGIITMWGGVADLAVSGVGPLAASASPSLDGLVYPSTLLQFGFVGVGTVFIVVADVFRRGLILQRETEGLV